MNHRRTRAERAFDVANVSALSLIALGALFPFLYVVLLSLSGPADVAAGGLLVIPRQPTLEAYRMVLGDVGFRTGLVNTLLRTVFGTAATLLATALLAYPLSRARMPWRRQLIFYVLFTTLFSGGVVPRYLLVKELGLIDSRLALVLPVLMTAFSVFILKNFFQQIPIALEEAARLEGASDLHVLFRIFIPLSKPALATIALWTAVMHWNHWFDAMLFVTSDDKQVLQIFLQRLVVENNLKDIQYGVADLDASMFSGEAVKAAAVVVVVLPIALVYPALQRFFVKGIMLGGVKE
jgi:putative aldouronate transport system permease protein